MQIYTRYNHAHPISPHGGVSLTSQQYKDECDIDKILKTYGATGVIPVNVRQDGISGDFSNIGDFESCLDRINKAKSEFASLPSQLRSRFGNDPVAFVEFVLDERNIDECVRLGLRNNPVPPAPPVTPDKEHAPAKDGAGIA